MGCAEGVYDQTGIEAAGRWIGSRLRPGDAVLLHGPLGAGKSTLARALIRAACGDASLEVPSPSYTLVQTYAASAGFPLHHFDLWRLCGPGELAELGWEEACLGAVVVEWAERLGPLEPLGALHLTLSIAGPERRGLAVAGWTGRRGAEA